MQFQAAWSELMSWVPKLSPLMAQKFVRRAWSDIRDSRLWSFQCGETTLDAVEQITAGTVTVTNGLTTVLGDATAFAAWNAVSNASFVTRQFRSGSGPIYNISSYTSPNITLDRVFAEATVAGASYSIYKCYYPAPTNFLRWTSIIDPIDGYQFGTDYTKEWLDLRDPIRGAMSQPYLVASYKYDTAESPTGWLFELYPHPIVQRSYPAFYQSVGTDFATATSIQPSIVSDDTLMLRSRYWAYEWAAANSAAQADLRNVDWTTLRTQADKDYRVSLFSDQKQDEEIFPQNWVENYTRKYTKGPVYDGNYALNHAPPYSYWRG